MLEEIPFFLFAIATILTLVALIRYGTLPRRRRRRKLQFSMQALLLAATVVAMLGGMVVMISAK